MCSRKATLGSASGVTLTTGTHLAYLTEVIDGELWNAVQGIWEDGVGFVPTRRRSLPTGGDNVVRSAERRAPAAVDAILDEFLDAYSAPLDVDGGRGCAGLWRCSWCRLVGW